MNVLVLHGPTLNLLGTRGPAVYGSATLPDFGRELMRIAKEAGGKPQLGAPGNTLALKSALARAPARN